MGGWVPPLKHVGDIHIRDLPSEFNIELRLPELKQFHQVFQSLRITTLSDIVDASGRIIRGHAHNVAIPNFGGPVNPSLSLLLTSGSGTGFSPR